jgi:hypothetical protein
MRANFFESAAAASSPHWVDPVRSGLLLARSGAVIGLAVGALFGLLTHWLIGGEQHDFSSVMGLQADRYYLLAEEHVAAEAARRLLA